MSYGMHESVWCLLLLPLILEVELSQVVDQPLPHGRDGKREQRIEQLPRHVVAMVCNGLVERAAVRYFDAVQELLCPSFRSRVHPRPSR